LPPKEPLFVFFAAGVASTQKFLLRSGNNTEMLNGLIRGARRRRYLDLAEEEEEEA